MTGFSLNRGRLARYLALITILITGVILLTLMAGGGSESVAGATKGGEGKARVVGKVASVSGKTSGITVKSPGGSEHRLREGDQLHLNDVIDPDKGVEATLNLKVPNGVSGDDELVYIVPGEGDHHTITMERTGKDQTRVLIGD